MPETTDRLSVVVTDVHIPFWSVVVLLVTWAVAAVPALLFLGVVVGIIVAAISVIGLVV